MPHKFWKCLHPYPANKHKNVQAICIYLSPNENDVTPSKLILLEMLVLRYDIPKVNTPVQHVVDLSFGNNILILCPMPQANRVNKIL